jgi:hypothetical protein
MSTAPSFTTDHIKILKTKFTVGHEDEFYEITKNAKNKFQNKLTEGYLTGLKENKKEKSR